MQEEYVGWLTKIIVFSRRLLNKSGSWVVKCKQEKIWH